MKHLKTYLPILISVLMISLSRIPLHMGFLVFGALIPLLWFFGRRYYRTWELLIASSIFAAVFVAIVLSWISEVTPGGLVGIFIIYTVFYLLLFYAIQRIGRAFPAWRYPSFAALFVTFEYLQNFGETRFPWLNISYSLADYNILLQALDLIGTAGLSLLVIVVNILLFKLIKGSGPGTRKKAGLALAVLMLLWLGYGFYTQKSLELVRHDAGIFVMQPSIKQEMKWDDKAYSQILKTYDELSAKASADSAKILIFPEAAMPVYLLRDPGELAFLLRLMAKYDMEIFTGFPDYLHAPDGYHYPYYYYNAAALFKPEMEHTEPYYKNILVPVGERMLWLETFPFLWKLEFGQANWEFGKELKWYQSGGYEFSPNICYEIAFPELFHHMAIPRDKNGKLRKTDYLVNITNDAWFGTSYGPWLHGVMTRYRAIENRIQIYRSAQTGISMIVDPLGQTLAATKLFEKTNITAPLYTSKRIPLLRYIYKYPLLICLFAAFMFIVAIFRRREI